MNEPKILLKIDYGENKVKRVSTRKLRRINQILKLNNFEDCVFNIKVVYPSGGDNEGDYKTKEELIEALKNFLEADD